MRLARLQSEEGMTLIELLIAMVVMAIGISAIVAGFSSGILAVNRAKLTSTVGALADKQMELYRQAAFTSPDLSPRHMSGGTQTGSDGNTYWLGTDISWICVVPPENRTYDATPLPCTGSPPSRRVKLVSIEVHKGSTSAGDLLFTESATFDSATG